MKRYATILYLFFSIILQPAAEQVIQLGGDQGWGEFLAAAGVEVSVRGQQTFLQLAEPRIQPGPDSQLLLGFDELPLQDETGHYFVDRSIEQLSRQEFRFGNAAGAFRGEPLVLVNRSGRLFAPDTTHYAFTFSFWLYPSRLQDGEEILRWRGMQSDDSTPIVQELRFTIRDRRLRLQFDNMFLDNNLEMVGAEIVAHDGLLPRRWSHHFIRYNAEDGLLEYLVDGRPSAIRYMTDTGSENGGGFPLVLGDLSNGTLHIGDRLFGLLDDFHISNAASPVPEIGEGTREPGFIVTEAISLGSARSQIQSVSVDTEQMGRTDIRSYYRIGHRLDASGSLQGEWRPVPSDGVIDSDQAAGYIQLKVDLLPDGEGHSPRLHGIEIAYRELSPPIPPAGISITPDAEGLLVEWSPVFDETIGGYRVYYGTSPGRYFGEEAEIGSSPVDVGQNTSVRLEGLSSDVLYYVTVVSYDRNDSSLESRFSREVSARPIPQE
ncbi:MAG: LamG-like jellyroll fold domain-containing protein [Spirochaeta sp.]